VLSLAVFALFLEPGPGSRLATGPAPLPFLDLATGERPDPGVPVRGWCPDSGLQPNPRRLVGCGLPLDLAWPASPRVVAERLSYRIGEAVHRQEIAEPGGTSLILRGKVTELVIESLGRSAAGWHSQFREIPVGVRGLLPLAGEAGADPGHADGAGAAARFQEPFGVTVIGGDGGPGQRRVVADAGSHGLRLVDHLGRVSTPWGQPGTPGHQDGMADTRFNRPTFLAALARPGQEGPWRRPAGFLVADTGNQVIRKVWPDGRVTTLAGVPGQAGHRDGTAGQALFREPLGLALDSAGNLFVADRGNHAIRRIDPAGAVITLAGLPGVAGEQDGLGREARFRRLAGLALDRRERVLFAVDGHAIRRVGLDGAVSTVLGVPEVPGFADLAGNGGLSPCLRDPCGIAPARRGLVIADRGNHAIRAFDPETGALRTLAGDPGRAELRWGLLRDGIAGPLEGDHASLVAPAGIVADELGECFVTTGTCLGQLLDQRLPALEAPGLTLDAPELRCGEPFTLAIRVPGPDGRPFRYRLDVLEADGSLASRSRGTGRMGQPVLATAQLSRPGSGQARLLVVTSQGVSGSARIALDLR
jgi:hypothetical protein